MTQGIVVKYNGNQRYATTAITRAILRDIAAKVNVPLQVGSDWLCKTSCCAKAVETSF